MKLWLKNYLSTIFFILLIYGFYNSFSYFTTFFTATFTLQPLKFSIQSVDIFKWVIGLYILILPIFYLQSENKSKALIVIEYLFKKGKYFSYKANFEEKTSFLAWIVKAFWAPLMIFWLSEHIITMINKWVALYGTWPLWKINFLWFFDSYFFVFCFSFILFADVFFFTLWYLIESPKLKNTIKSVEPTLLWWAVALACYPPFNGYITSLIWWYSQDFPKFENISIHIGFNVAILLLMGIYSWASISLWFKASNLTNRGIVTKWPYRFVRHPAYIAKNLAWWIGGIPLMIEALQTNNYIFLSSIFFWLIWWSSIYFLRAWTEEQHLSKDPEYRKYKEKVRFRFIPWVF
jgi:protein-S-isoprenylcysteine O-methyltransferase Ste14